MVGISSCFCFSTSHQTQSSDSTPVKDPDNEAISNRPYKLPAALKAIFTKGKPATDDGKAQARSSQTDALAPTTASFSRARTESPTSRCSPRPPCGQAAALVVSLSGTALNHPSRQQRASPPSKATSKDMQQESVSEHPIGAITTHGAGAQPSGVVHEHDPDRADPAAHQHGFPQPEYEAERMRGPDPGTARGCTGDRGFSADNPRGRPNEEDPANEGPNWTYVPEPAMQPSPSLAAHLEPDNRLSVSARRLLARRLQEHAAQQHFQHRLSIDRESIYASSPAKGSRLGVVRAASAASRIVRLTSDAGSPRTTNRALLTRQRTPYALRRMTGSGAVGGFSGTRAALLERPPSASSPGATAAAAAAGGATGPSPGFSSHNLGNHITPYAAEPPLPRPHAPGRLLSLQQRCQPAPAGAAAQRFSGSAAWPPMAVPAVQTGRLQGTAAPGFLDADPASDAIERGAHRARFVDSEGNESGLVSPHTRAPALLLRQQTPMPLQWGRNWFTESCDGDSSATPFANWTEAGSGLVTGPGLLTETRSHGLAEVGPGGRARSTYSGSTAVGGSAEPLTMFRGRGREWSRVGSLRASRTSGPGTVQQQQQQLQHPHVTALRVRPSLCKSRRPSVSSSMNLCSDPDLALPVVLPTSTSNTGGANTPTRRGRRRNLAGNEQFGWDAAVLASRPPLPEQQLPTPFGSQQMPPSADAPLRAQSGFRSGIGGAAFASMSTAAAAFERAPHAPTIPEGDVYGLSNSAGLAGLATQGSVKDEQGYVEVPGTSCRRMVLPWGAQGPLPHPGVSALARGTRQESSYGSLRMLDIAEAPSPPPLSLSPLALPRMRPRTVQPPVPSGSRKALEGCQDAFVDEYTICGESVDYVSAQLNSQGNTPKYASQTPDAAHAAAAAAAAASTLRPDLDWRPTARATQSSDGSRGLLLPFEGRKPFPARDRDRERSCLGAASFRRAGFNDMLRPTSGTDLGLVPAATTVRPAHAPGSAYLPGGVVSREGRCVLRHANSVRSTAPTEDDSAESLAKLGGSEAGRGCDSCAAELADSSWPSQQQLASADCRPLMDMGYVLDDAPAAEPLDAPAQWLAGDASPLAGQGQGQGQKSDRSPRFKSTSQWLVDVAVGGAEDRRPGSGGGGVPLRHPVMGELVKAAALASAGGSSRLSRCT